VTEPISNTSQSLELYERALAQSDWLKRLPFEHIGRNISHEQFVRRLLQERGLFLGGMLPGVAGVHLIVIADNDPSKFRRTFESCILQSALGFTITIVSQNPAALNQAERYCQERLASDKWQSEFAGRIAYSKSIRDCTKDHSGYLIILHSGDILHLSCVMSVCLELTRGEVDVCSWNETQVDFSEGAQVRKSMRKPQLEPYTLYHFNYIGDCFAFRSEFGSWFSQIDRCFFEGDVHYFLLSILENSKYRFAMIPQYLLLRDVENVRDQAASQRLDHYCDYFAQAGFAFNCSEPGRYSLSPEKRAKTISVIIPFRDEPELTCRAVESVINQDSDAYLELVLIDNESNSRTRELIGEFLKRVVKVPSSNVQLIRYNKPFNHSAQCNLGASYAHGESFVFMNNDAQLLSPNALVEMAAWSLVSDVGTVGIRMLHDMEGKRQSAGIRARLAGGTEFNSPVEEDEDREWGSFNRQTWGNSFACAATSRKTFKRVGPLDEINFPNGYNDVDYSMRCRKAGLVNIYLGTVSIYHKPGSSRGRYDEIYQKLLLKQKFPEIGRDGLFQLDAIQIS